MTQPEHDPWDQDTWTQEDWQVWRKSSVLDRCIWKFVTWSTKDWKPVLCVSAVAAAIFVLHRVLYGFWSWQSPPL